MNIDIKTPNGTLQGIVNGRNFRDVTPEEDLQNWYIHNDLGDGQTQAIPKKGYIAALQHRVEQAIENDDPDVYRCAAQAGIDMVNETRDISKLAYEIDASGQHTASAVIDQSGTPMN